MKYKIIKLTGLGVMEAPYVEEETGIEFNSLEEAKTKSHELFIQNVPKEVRKSSWCYESYFVKDSNNKKYY